LRRTSRPFPTTFAVDSSTSPARVATVSPSSVTTTSPNVGCTPSTAPDRAAEVARSAVRASRAAAFETEVGYFSRSRHDVPYQYLPSLEALAEWCGVLMIAVRAGADTHHAVDASILRKLGKDGYVVNISRGSVIDQQALVAALAEESIAGAGLDVYEMEPHPPDALTAFPNVVLTPHVGGHTLESHVAMQNCVIANLEAFFAGKPLPHTVRGT